MCSFPQRVKNREVECLIGVRVSEVAVVIAVVVVAAVVLVVVAVGSYLCKINMFDFTRVRIDRSWSQSVIVRLLSKLKIV